MQLDWEQVIVDSSDPQALGRWSASALGWVTVNDDPEEFEIRPALDQIPGLRFVRVPEGSSKSRGPMRQWMVEYRRTVAVYRRKNLKRPKQTSDEAFLRGAKASATRAANRLERQRRAEQTLHELDKPAKRGDANGERSKFPQSSVEPVDGA